MENKDNTIKINGIEPPLHLENEPGRYQGFVSNLLRISNNELNSGKTLEVKMLSQNEAEKLLIDLNNLDFNVDKAFITKIENNFLIVKKQFTYKIGK